MRKMRNTSYLIAHWFCKMALPFSVVQKIERRLLSSYEPFIFNWKGQRKNHPLGLLPFIPTSSAHLFSPYIREYKDVHTSLMLDSFLFLISHTNAFISWLTYICGLIHIPAPSIALLQLQTQRRWVS